MDEFNNMIDTGRFMKVMADIETGKDEPEPHTKWLEPLENRTVYEPFKRDQNLTPAALFKAKVLAVLSSERAYYDDNGDADGKIVCEYLRNLIEAIAP